MRTMTINIFLLAIGICDISQMTVMIIQLSDQFWTEYLETIFSSECILPPTYFERIQKIFLDCFLISTRELSIYFSVTMAVFRAVIIKFPLTPRISSLINSNRGKFIIFGVFTFYSPIWLLSLFEVKIIEIVSWRAPSHCENVPKNYTQARFNYIPFTIFGFEDNRFQQTIEFCEGAFSRLLPLVVLPVATATTSVKNKDRTTKLVITMTVSFLVATTPSGILCITTLLTIDSYGIQLINDQFSYMFGSLYFINGSIHCLICVLMSSQYRDTVRQLFGIGDLKITEFIIKKLKYKASSISAVE
ncbi:unnamed protein product [Caenorhabditis nigoni]